MTERELLLKHAAELVQVHERKHEVFAAANSLSPDCGYGSMSRELFKLGALVPALMRHSITPEEIQQEIARKQTDGR